VVLYLYISAFLSFVAAILDLSHILTGGRSVVVHGITRDAPSPITTVREVGFALSIGCLYVFLWHLVAQRPRNEQSPMSFQGYKLDGSNHSASWNRWGILGRILQWTLLALSATISILQIVWRLLPFSSQFSTFYIAETTIEITTSGLLILKIVLNIFVSVSMPWSQSFRSNLAPLIALSISVALGIGNLVSVLFSETILGRFLRAIEMYILILFLLITTFYRESSDAVPDAIPSRLEKGIPINDELSEKPLSLVDHISRHVSLSDPLLTGSGVIPMYRSNRIDFVREPRRTSRVTWLMTARDWRGSVESATSQDASPFIAATPTSSNLAPSYHTALRLPNRPRPNVEQDKHLTLGSAASISSYYRMDQRSIGVTVPPSSDSPMENLDLHVDGANVISGDLKECQHRPQSSLSFSELLRQQSELDKSIAALALYTSDDSSASEPIGQDPYLRKNPKSWMMRVSTGSYIGQRKIDSDSNRSDFSLSGFPEPPKDESTVPNSIKLEQLVGRARRLRLEPIAPRRLQAESMERESLPVSPGEFGGVSRMDSKGTQYDVTSFIGGFMSGSGSNFATGSVDLRAADRPSVLGPAEDLHLRNEVLPPVVPRKRAGMMFGETEGKAYRRESLKTHPDRLPPDVDPAQKRRATEAFQALADAYYVLSNAQRRREYDAAYASRPDRTSDPSADPGLFSRFTSSFSTSGPTSRPDADNVFADVFEEV
ncbi:hypothetical protein H0H93_002827, partial [Arthromyces matolae]